MNHSIVRGEPKVHHRHLVFLLHVVALLKAVLPFDFVTTSGQKPSTLCAHFTQPYWALDTLPNLYY